MRRVRSSRVRDQEEFLDEPSSLGRGVRLWPFQGSDIMGVRLTSSTERPWVLMCLGGQC